MHPRLDFTLRNVRTLAESADELPMPQKLIVEVWSDVVCPFCYLGKRKFANALSRFAHRDEVEVVWKSFQLNPSVRTDPTISINDFLAREKGFDVRTAEQLHDRISRAGREVGLDYRFDRAIVANTFDAHRVIHFASAQGKGDEAFERLFRAYFTEGRNIGDRATLVELGADIGLDAPALSAALESDAYADAVRSDIEDARQLGINGVPFFVLDRTYGVSGAQDAGIFLQALEQARAETAVRQS
jgi:predicted DsbA family dithiol-disulfide isomerase